jgi:RNA polymerase sigma-70 factor, ECF subfamily
VDAATNGKVMGAQGAGEAASEAAEVPVWPGERFEGFYEREYPGLVRLAHVLSGSGWAAEDIAQEALLGLYRDWGRIANPRAWIRRAVASLSTSLLRRAQVEARARTRLLLGQRPRLGELPGEHALFWEAVRSLPRRQAQVVALYYLEDCPVKEIGETLGCAEGTVRATLHQARGRLHRRLRLPEEERP